MSSDDAGGHGGHDRTTALFLFMASLVTLYLGRFIRFDDLSGFGHERWVIPLGVVGVILAVSSVTLSLRSRPARRVMSAVLAVLVGTLVVLSVTNDGFRFVWEDDSGELFNLDVGLALVALFLWVPAFRRSDSQPASGALQRLPGPTRLALYVTGLVIGMYVAFGVGASRFESAHCSGPEFDGDCDTSGLAGLLWAGGLLLLGLVLIAVVEVTRHQRSQTVGKVGRA